MFPVWGLESNWDILHNENRGILKDRVESTRCSTTANIWFIGICLRALNHTFPLEHRSRHIIKMAMLDI